LCHIILGDSNFSLNNLTSSLQSCRIRTTHIEEAVHAQTEVGAGNILRQLSVMTCRPQSFVFVEVPMNEMMSLSDEDKSLLIVCLKKHDPGLIDFLNRLGSAAPDKAIAKLMINTVIDESVGDGFDSDWELNEYGSHLEKLIERLSDLWLWPEEIQKLKHKHQNK
jgi:hypothetical protein